MTTFDLDHDPAVVALVLAEAQRMIVVGSTYYGFDLSPMQFDILAGDLARQLLDLDPVLVESGDRPFLMYRPKPPPPSEFAEAL